MGPRNRRAALITLALSGAFALGAGAVWSWRRSPPDAASDEAAAWLFELKLPDADGVARPLKTWEGKLLVVNFWATWCTPCRQEMPLLSAADKRLGGKVAILGVDVKDNRAEAVRFLAERGIAYPSAYDPEASLRRSFELVGLPVTVLVGRDGRVVDRVTGAVTRGRLDGLLARGQAPE